MILFSGFTVIFHNAPQASLRTAGMVGFCFMTATKAYQGTEVSGWEREMVLIWYGLGWVRVGNGFPLALTQPLE